MKLGASSEIALTPLIFNLHSLAGGADEKCEDYTMLANFTRCLPPASSLRGGVMQNKFGHNSISKKAQC